MRHGSPRTRGRTVRRRAFPLMVGPDAQPTATRNARPLGEPPAITVPHHTARADLANRHLERPHGISPARRAGARSLARFRTRWALDPRALFSLWLLMELCLLGTLAIAPLGGMTQSVSPLTWAWPWLFTPARLLFPGMPLHVDAGPQDGSAHWPAVVFAGLLVVATLALGGVLLACVRARAPRHWHLALAVVGAAILGGTLVLLPSLPSDDVFSYVMYGRIAIVHHANPLIAVPSRFANDPFLGLVYWRNVRSVYGPIWLLMSNGITALAEALGGSLATYVLLFKLLGLVCHLVNMVLIWAILGRVAPRRRLLGTLMYGWSPLCLLEFCASAHNDALMLTFLLLSVLLLVRRWEVPALLAFGIAVAIKYVPIALLPVYLFAIVYLRVMARGRLAEHRERALPRWLRGGDAAGVRGVMRVVARNWRWSDLWAATWRLGIVLAVVIVATLPFWAGPGTFKSILYSPPAQRLNNSLLEVIMWPLIGLVRLTGLRPSWSQILVETVLKAAAMIAFGALWLREFRRARGLPGMLSAWAWILFWYVVVASGWFWPWYVTWVVVFVALLPWDDLTLATLLLAGGVLTLYGFQPLYAAPVYGLRAYVAFGPAVGYLVWRWRQARAVAGDES